MEGEAKKRDVEKERYRLPAAKSCGAGAFVHPGVQHVPPSAGFDGLPMMAERIIRCNRFSGHVCVFRNPACGGRR